MLSVGGRLILSRLCFYQVLIDQFDVIERFPSLQNAPAPPRKVLTLCQHLISDLRLATSERDELITRLLKAENTHIRTAGLTALRTLVVAEEMVSRFTISVTLGHS